MCGENYSIFAHFPYIRDLIHEEYFGYFVRRASKLYDGKSKCQRKKEVDRERLRKGFEEEEERRRERKDESSKITISFSIF
jgi:hypothetical protein